MYDDTRSSLVVVCKFSVPRGRERGREGERERERGVDE